MTSASGTTPVTFSCAQTRDRFAAYLDERLAREERRGVRGHLEDCASCRAEASAQDPAFLFAFVGAGAGIEEVSPEETARILAAVRTGIELKTAERRVRRRGAYGAGAAASVAAAALVAVLAGSSGIFRTPRAVSAAAAASAVPASAPAAEKSGPAALVPAEVSQSAAPVSPFAEARGPARGQKLPADATIYDWNPGGGQPRVVWIVDRSLDI